MEWMNLIQAQIETALATDIRWLIDNVLVNDRGIEISGWITTLRNNFDNFSILFNETLADKIILRQDSALGDYYPALGAPRFRRFVANVNRDLAPEEGCYRFSMISGCRPNARTYRTAWFCPDYHAEIPIPDGERIKRVIGNPNSTSYLMGGSTIVRRFELYLRERFAMSVADFDRVLDWGCGSARLTSHLLRLNANTWGIDIDKDNIDWCNRSVRQGAGHFRHISLMPPTPFLENEFDLIVGVSVFTHLGEDDQFRWLAELARITKPGGIALISIKGLSVFAMERTNLAIVEKLYNDHITVTALNHDLIGHIEDETYYKDVLHTSDYIFSFWSRYFEIVDIIPGLALPQDLVVMRKPSL
jgi:SAM-dependent methyltransferase